MLENDNADWGLVHALVLDGQGGARAVARADLVHLQLAEHESLWLHWDRGQVRTHAWLREESGLNAFSCDLLLEENTRPRLVPLPNARFLLFLRGINLNPGAQPEDMVSVRIFAEERRVISLRLRSLRATEDLVARLAAGEGPRNAADLVLYLAERLTERIQAVVDQLTETLDTEEERVDSEDGYAPEHSSLLHLRRRSAGLRRFLAPQRDLFALLARNCPGWFSNEHSHYWNELNNSLTRYLEELELNRERVALLIEAEQRQLSERMNRTMYRFGVVTGIFLPITFITGLLGMNVGGLPGADNSAGFLITCGVTLAVAVGQWLLYRQLRWL
ncbi:zinc transporter ZntB [Pseudomonas massiliensis]|uniref:zinc transporter ZntB n=1 Tax=Pseudomonas massiliensis TaxID=522492 RepID=UPI00058C39C6|nr:zinc transporter ZntB [Pseudomonas massiliensis]